MFLCSYVRHDSRLGLLADPSLSLTRHDHRDPSNFFYRPHRSPKHSQKNPSQGANHYSPNRRWNRKIHIPITPGLPYLSPAQKATHPFSVMEPIIDPTVPQSPIIRNRATALVHHIPLLRRFRRVKRRWSWRHSKCWTTC